MSVATPAKQASKFLNEEALKLSEKNQQIINDDVALHLFFVRMMRLSLAALSKGTGFTQEMLDTLAKMKEDAQQYDATLRSMFAPESSRLLNKELKKHKMFNISNIVKHTMFISNTQSTPNEAILTEIEAYLNHVQLVQRCKNPIPVKKHLALLKFARNEMSKDCNGTKTICDYDETSDSITFKFN